MEKDFSSLDLNKTYTYADYLTWQFKERLELIKGKIFRMSPAPAREHQSISGALYREFSYFRNTHFQFYFFSPHPLFNLSNLHSIYS
jgi:hypothetical protein